MAGIRALKELIEQGGRDAIPQIKKMLDDAGLKLSDVFDLDEPYFHGTANQFDDYKPDQYFSNRPEIASSYAVDPIEAYSLDDLDRVAKYADVAPQVRKVYTPNEEWLGGYHTLDDLKKLGDVDEELPWINIDKRSGEGNLRPLIGKNSETGVQFDWTAEKDIHGKEIFPKSRERMLIDPGGDAVDAYSMESLLKKAPDLRTIANMGIPTLAALSMLQPEEAEAAFVGKFSKLIEADDMLLDMAQKMQRAGKTREEIFDNTGFMQDKFGDWKLEVPDHNLAFDDYGKFADEAVDAQPLWMHAEHPDLEAHYPDVEYVNLKSVPRGSSYGRTGQPGSGEIGDINLHNAIPSRGTNKMYNNPEGILGHELQHGIQDLEGWSQGGAPSSFDKAAHLKIKSAADAAHNRLNKMIEVFEATKHRMSPEEHAKNVQLITDYDQTVLDKIGKIRRSDPKENYMRLGGETEARNVTKRMVEDHSRYTRPAGDPNRYPWNTADRSEDVLLESPLDSPYLDPKYEPFYKEQLDRKAANKIEAARVRRRARMAKRANPGRIEAPAHPRVAKLSQGISDLNRTFENHPLGMVLPGTATATWLNRLAYKQTPTWQERAGVLLDFL